MCILAEDLHVGWEAIRSRWVYIFDKKKKTSIWVLQLNWILWDKMEKLDPFKLALTGPSLCNWDTNNSPFQRNTTQSKICHHLTCNQYSKQTEKLREDLFSITNIWIRPATKEWIQRFLKLYVPYFLDME